MLQISMKNFLRIMYAIYLILLAGSVSAESNLSWLQKSEKTRAQMVEMDEIIRDRQTERSFQRYMQFFSPDIQAFGLYDDGPTNLEGLKKHYYPVFFELRDGVLLSDEVITAGPMAAQRYHSMLYLDGEFDGVKARGQPVHLRGQTFFQFNENGNVSKRWSNHDHSFRMQQLLGEKGAIDGANIALQLNGPGLSEASVIEKLKGMTDAYNLVHTPKQRLSQYLAFFSDDVKVHGLEQTVSNHKQLSSYLEKQWTAFPDLMRIDETYLSAWSYGAVRWRALGSHRDAYQDKIATLRPVILKGESIMKFNNAGKITEIWINDAAITYQ